MARYIDADALLKHTTDHDMISTHLIYNAPTADVVEVVRCRDCEFWQDDWLTSHDGYHYCSMVDLITDGDFYCSYAEREILPKD